MIGDVLLFFVDLVGMNKDPVFHGIKVTRAKGLVRETIRERKRSQERERDLEDWGNGIEMRFFLIAQTIMTLRGERTIEEGELSDRCRTQIRSQTGMNQSLDCGSLCCPDEVLDGENEIGISSCCQLR